MSDIKWNDAAQKIFRKEDMRNEYERSRKREGNCTAEGGRKSLDEYAYHKEMIFID